MPDETPTDPAELVQQQFDPEQHDKPDVDAADDTPLPGDEGED